jgi:hypothetical protein
MSVVTINEPDSKIYALASKVVSLIDMQRGFFKTRNPDLLIQCKKIEKSLHDECSALIKELEAKHA